MLKWTLGFLIGCTLINIIPQLPSIYLIVVIGVVSFLLLIVASQLKSAKIFMTLISGLLAGFFWVTLNAQWQLTSKIPHPINNKAHIIEAEIISLPVIYPEYCKFLAVINESDEQKLINKKVQLNWYSEDCEVKLGQTWIVEAKFKPIAGSLNIAGFDKELYLFHNGIDGIAIIKPNSTINKLSQPSSYLSLGAVRQSLHQQLNQLTNKGFFQAIVLGQRQSISTEQEERFQQLGISHLVAISGLHISIIAGFFFILARQLAALVVTTFRMNLSPLHCAVVMSCIAAFVYSALAGFAIPTQRALIMWLVVSGAFLMYRSLPFYYSLMIALLLTLVLFPLSVLSVSFWMTYAAMSIICLVLFGRQQKQHWLLSMLKIQVAITGITSLFALLFFQQLTLLGLLVNVIIIPVFSFFFLPMLFFSLIVFIIFDSRLLLDYLDSAVTYLWNILEKISPLVDILVFKVHIPGWAFIGILIGLLLIVLPVANIKKPLLLIVCVWLSAHISLISTQNQHPKIEFFDVGHGLSVLIHDGSSAVLYDTGFGNENFSMAKSQLIPSLRKLGIKKLDALIVSHADSDHAGGLKDVLESVEVKRLIIGDWYTEQPHQTAQYENKHYNTTLCDDRLFIRLGQFSIKGIHPEKGFVGKSNNTSCVIKVSFDDFSLLLTGDIENEVEMKLAKRSFSENIRANILLAPHHGSKSSSSYAFIKAVSAEHVIYSTDRNNRYGMPHKQVQQRYQQLGVKEWLTGCSGQLTYDVLTDRFYLARADRRVWRNLDCK